MVDRQIANFLHQSARPANGRADRAVRLAEAEEHVFAVLRKKTGACLQGTHLTAFLGFQRDYCADRIAIAFRAAQAKSDGRRQVLA